MGIADLIKNTFSSRGKGEFQWAVDPYEGIDFKYPSNLRTEPELHAMNNPWFGAQLAYLRGLAEQGKALNNANGYTVLSSVVTELGDDFTSFFDMPEDYPGSYVARFTGNTGKALFTVDIDLIIDGQQVSHYELYGPCLKLAENEHYRLNSAEWQALNAIKAHKTLSPDKRSEYENNWLVFQLQLAKKHGMKLDLAHFNDLEIINPESIGISLEETSDGGLLLTPSFGSGIGAEDIQKRLGQITSDQDGCVLRVGDKFVLLDEERVEAANEILSNRKIPNDQVKKFLDAPTAYLNAALIDFDTGFSLRVHGAEKFSHRYFGDVEKSGVDWFSSSESSTEGIDRLKYVVHDEQTIDEVEQLISDAYKNGADTIEYQGKQYDISNEEEVKREIESLKASPHITADNETVDSQDNQEHVTEEVLERAVVAIDSNDEDVEYSKDSRVTGLETTHQSFDQSNLLRSPFPHQVEGIQWILAHLDLIHEKKEPSGALLADDMGLGKTYMTLVSVNELYRRCQERGEPLKPVLFVAPLSLLENWQTEVDETFSKSPFNDVVILQKDGVKSYRVKGAGRETQQNFNDGDLITDDEKIRYSLKIGKHYGNERLDMPARMVLTTYQTLRDYQFSLSRIDWSMVVFDEAQNLKNPNALATRAAKGLKSDFKLLATGTPVENSLKDFWCLMDTAIPGLLGAWQDFRGRYIAPILSASDDEVLNVKVEVGKELRARVGDYMLRRTKAEKLKGLPEKRIFTADASSEGEQYLDKLAAVMTGEQLAHYDEIINSVRNNEPGETRKFVLPSLRRLKVTSIHHGIDTKDPIPQSAGQFKKHALSSAKIKSVLSVLEDIRKRKEKVLIFAETKAVQAYMCALIISIFKIPVDVINGEVNATPTKTEKDTRKSIIDRFQNADGFGVIVISPIAAGVGLTVVGANNVIHLERHWNPAKEAQATDRVYRIGQKRDVNVYLPMALHPTLRSFDLQLNKLLENKIDLSEAVVSTPEATPADFEDCF